jgi:hypothetical protein
VTEGSENMTMAFIGMLCGENIGKVIVKVWFWDGSWNRRVTSAEQLSEITYQMESWQSLYIHCIIKFEWCVFFTLMLLVWLKYENWYITTPAIWYLFTWLRNFLLNWNPKAYHCHHWNPSIEFLWEPFESNLYLHILCLCICFEIFLPSLPVFLPLMFCINNHQY